MSDKPITKADCQCLGGTWVEGQMKCIIIFRQWRWQRGLPAPRESDRQSRGYWHGLGAHAMAGGVGGVQEGGGELTAPPCVRSNSHTR